MIWALLAILGVPLWLVAGALGAAVWNRSRVTNEAGSFTIRLRSVHGVSHGTWSRKARARWMHDVLIVSRGPGLGQTSGYPVASQARAPHPDPATCKGLGDAPIALSIGTDHGDSFEIAAAADDADLLFLPFS